MTIYSTLPDTTIEAGKPASASLFLALKNRDQYLLDQINSINEDVIKPRSNFLIANTRSPGTSVEYSWENNFDYPVLITGHLQSGAGGGGNGLFGYTGSVMLYHALLDVGGKINFFLGAGGAAGSTGTDVYGEDGTDSYVTANQGFSISTLTGLEFPRVYGSGLLDSLKSYHIFSVVTGELIDFLEMPNEDSDAVIRTGIALSSKAVLSATNRLASSLAGVAHCKLPIQNAITPSGSSYASGGVPAYGTNDTVPNLPDSNPSYTAEEYTENTDGAGGFATMRIAKVHY